MAHLSICLLGPFQVTLDGVPVTRFDSDKARALLAFVAVEVERPLRRETLAGLLWPESPERSARTNLRSALANVRWVIGDHIATPPFLHVSRQTIQFNMASDAWSDVRAYTELLEASRAPPTTDRRIGEAANQAKTQHLEEAVKLYRGSFLEGFSLVDCPGYEEWALLEREQLQRQALRALQRLAAHYEGCGEYERALRYAWRAVDLDPWREEAQRQLMRLLALSGQRTAALAQYEACCRTLAEELGVEPEQDTTALFQQIKGGELSPAEHRSPSIPNNLPTPLTPFVGREAQLAEIRERLDDPACRLLTLVGPGGIGKTRLAIQAATEIVQAPYGRTAFSHGVFFVPLASVDEVGALAPAIASSVGFSFYGEISPNPGRFDEVDATAQLFGYLREKKMLLVLDNFEHLLPPAPPQSPPEGGKRDVAPSRLEGGTPVGRAGVNLLTEILRVAPGVKLLVTSREGLCLQPEWFYPLEGMAFPSQDGTEAEGVTLALKDYSAVALFAQCARRTCPGFSLAREKGAVVRICQLVEGMPLAIELAAAWLKVLSPARIASEIERGLDILSTSLRDVESRHRSMRAVFDHSWRLLSETERRALRRLSVFRGGFRLKAAEATAGTSLPILAGLVEKSLLRVAPAGRYYTHELLRQYALERLQEDPQEGEGVRDRHSDYYARLVEMRGEALKGPDQRAALAEIEAESENARVAWNWAAEQRRVERLGNMLEGLCLFYQRRLRAREGEVACQQAADRLLSTAKGDRAIASQSGAEGLKILARILAWQASFCPPECAGLADQLLERSLTILERPELAGEDTRKEKAFLFRQMGQRAFVTDLELARSLYEQSLALYRALDDRWWMARVLEPLAWSAAYLGAYEKTIRYHEESLALRRALGDQRGIAESYRGLAAVALLGKIEEGMQSVRKCIAIWRQVGDRAGIAGGLNQLAPGLILTGRFAEAFKVLEESLGICSDLGLRWGEAWANVWLGFAELHAGKYEQARSQGEAVLAFSREFRDHEFIGRSLCLLGDVALAGEAYAEARSLLEESVASYRAYGLPNELVWALADLAVATRGLGQFGQARKHMREALRTAVDVRAVLSLPWIVPKTALFCADMGELERAVEIYALASRSPGVAKSRWFEEVCGRSIATIATTLPPEVVTAAQERGSARDLKATVEELLVELK